jgi:hypothetical protein
MIPTKAVPADAMVRVDEAGTPAIAIPVITSLAHSIAAGLSTAGQDGPDRQDSPRRRQTKRICAYNSSSKRMFTRNHNSSGAARDPCVRSTRSCRAVRHMAMRCAIESSWSTRVGKSLDAETVVWVSIMRRVTFVVLQHSPEKRWACSRVSENGSLKLRRSWPARSRKLAREHLQVSLRIDIYDITY